MKSAVLDSNIFISAFLFNGKQRKILEKALSGNFRIYSSEPIISEIRAVLERPKFKLSAEQIKMILSEIEFVCELVYPSKIAQNICRDRDDHIILECAIEAKADYIITGDEDLLCLNPYQGIQIINSGKFLDLL